MCYIFQKLWGIWKTGKLREGGGEGCLSKEPTFQFVFYPQILPHENKQVISVSRLYLMTEIRSWFLNTYKSRSINFNILIMITHQNESEGICRTLEKILLDIVTMQREGNSSQSKQSPFLILVKWIWWRSLFLVVRIDEILSELGRKTRTTPKPDVVHQTSGQGSWDASVCYSKPITNYQPTKKGPSQPVVSCSKHPGMGVESQEQGRYARWHTEVLEGIEESEEVVFSFECFGSIKIMLLNQDHVEIPLLLALTMHDSEQCSSWCHRSDGQIVKQKWNHHD